MQLKSTIAVEVHSEEVIADLISFLQNEECCQHLTFISEKKNVNHIFSK